MPSKPPSAGARPFNPLRLDVSALADRGEPLQGQWPLVELTRLVDPAEPPIEAQAVVDWQARAERRPVRGGPPELWLHLGAQALVHRTCQRCLQATAVPLSIERSFLFAPTEAQAQAWDAERDDADVLVLDKSLNLLELAEDELLLSLPLVPRHEVCPQPLIAPGEEEGPPDQSSPEGEKGDNPFAVLAQLKRRH